MTIKNNIDCPKCGKTIYNIDDVASKHELYDEEDVVEIECSGCGITLFLTVEYKPVYHLSISDNNKEETDSYYEAELDNGEKFKY